MEAHALPVAQLATALWESWVPPSIIGDTFAAAKGKLGACAGSYWSVVAGPVAAAIASMWRLGWQTHTVERVVDDCGVEWSLSRDGPAAIRAAVVDSVRRWRFGRITAAFPTLLEGVDAIERAVVDCGEALAGLLRGGTPKAVRGVWEHAARPWLLSALSGGQWPQARRVAVRSWAVGDPTCQLCRAAPGTLLHRRRCPATIPAGGWLTPQPAVSYFLDAQEGGRRDLLQTRALLVVAIPRPPVLQAPKVRWLLPVPAVLDADIQWCTDGSVLNALWPDLASAACAFVAFDSTGAVRACGCAELPTSVRTSTAAEAWALRIVVMLSPFPPRVITDCKCLLTTAMMGAAAATSSRSALAATWSAIAAALDGDLRGYVVRRQLRWMKAHMSRQRAATARLSDGSAVTLLLWRGNRLVDALAGLTAAARAPAAADAQQLCLAKAAVQHEAAVLGIVTHAANAHRVEVPRDGGGARIEVRRDAVGPRFPPRRKGARPERRAEEATAKERALDERDVARATRDACATARTHRTSPLSRSRSPRHPARARASAARSSATATARALGDHVVREAISWRMAAATASTDDGSARFAALRARIAARSAAPAS